MNPKNDEIPNYNFDNESERGKSKDDVKEIVDMDITSKDEKIDDDVLNRKKDVDDTEKRM